MTADAKTRDWSGAHEPAVLVLAAISLCHMLNDVIQSLIMAIYPMLKSTFALDFGQIGLITFTFQLTASILQPVVGYVTDRHPTPYALVVGMGSSLVGLVILALASSYGMVLLAAAPDRHGIVGVPPRVLAGGAARLGRAARPRPVGVPGRRQFRHGDRAAARRLHRAAPTARAASPGSRWWRSSAWLLAGVGSWYGKTLKFNGAGAGAAERKAIAELGRGPHRARRSPSWSR